jgi:hypothetical protein
MNIDRKILEEINRYRSINNYINEQGLPEDPLAGGAPPPPGDPLAGGDPMAGPPPAPDAGGAPPAPDAGGSPPAPDAGGAPVDVSSDPDVEEVGKEEEDEELDITDLVTAQKNIETKQEEYFQNLFKQLEALDSKLKEMDGIASKLSAIEDKVDKYKPKTPQEKLELRSLDSGPFKQKLSDFFVDKQEEMEKSGKNEYILTTDEVKDFSSGQIEDSFNDYLDEE